MSVDFYAGQFVPASDEVRGWTGRDTVLSWVEGDEAEGLRLNMHNRGAGETLLALGFEMDAEEGWVGHAAADDVVGRALVALALSPADEGMPAYQVNPGAEGVAKVYEGERPAGDLQRRLREVHDLAVWCAARGFLVVWC